MDISVIDATKTNTQKESFMVHRMLLKWSNSSTYLVRIADNGLKNLMSY